MSAALVLTILVSLAPQPPLEVDAMDVDRRSDLVGREITVDARIALFLPHPDGGFGEIALKESEVAYRLPPELRFRNPPRERVARIQGRLKREGDLLVVDVKSVQLLPSDIERLTRALRPLAPGELTTRSAWARWATHRAKIYNDPELAARALALQAEVLQIQASRPDSRSPEATLALARHARAEQIPEPAPSALAHRAFHARFAAARSVEQLDALATQIEELLPASKNPQVASPPNLAAVLGRYDDDPESTYLQSSPEIRAALDRRLLADIIERRILLQAKTDPRAALDLVNQARARLPDRPELAQKLRQDGLKARADDVTALRRAELLDLAAQLEQDGLPEQARSIKRDWLAHQRLKKLDKNDATGRRDLADDYVALLGDKTTAADLLLEALEIDPRFEKAGESLRRLGFRKEGEKWVDVGSHPQGNPAPASEPASQDDPLLNLTPEEVVSHLGQPNRRSLTITQGTLVMQWVYLTSGGKTQIVNFRKTSEPTPRVTSRYSTP
jgi:hypothetical protein